MPEDGQRLRLAARRRILSAMRRGGDDHALLALLQIDENAPWEDVHRAFRDAVRASHPDLHPGDADAERRLKTLNAGWETINTPGKWEIYTATAARRARRGFVRAQGTGTIPALGRIRVQRQLRGAAGLLNWRIALDGSAIASIENGGSRVFDARPGRHSLRVFYGTRSSLPLEVELRRGHELLLGCRQLESLRINLLARERCLVLELLGERRYG